MDREEEQDEAVGELIYRVGFSIISSSEIVSLFAPQLELHNEHSTLKLLKTRLNCCIDCTALVWTNPEAYIALSGKRETTNSNTVPGEEVEQRAAGGGGGCQYLSVGSSVLPARMHNTTAPPRHSNKAIILSTCTQGEVQSTP